jgi:hypothetical protein
VLAPGPGQSPVRSSPIPDMGHEIEDKFTLRHMNDRPTFTEKTPGLTGTESHRPPCHAEEERDAFECSPVPVGLRISRSGSNGHGVQAEPETSDSSRPGTTETASRAAVPHPSSDGDWRSPIWPRAAKFEWKPAIENATVNRAGGPVRKRRRWPWKPVCLESGAETRSIKRRRREERRNG